MSANSIERKRSCLLRLAALCYSISHWYNGNPSTYRDGQTYKLTDSKKCCLLLNKYLFFGLKDVSVPTLYLNSEEGKYRISFIKKSGLFESWTYNIDEEIDHLLNLYIEYAELELAECAARNDKAGMDSTIIERYAKKLDNIEEDIMSIDIEDLNLTQENLFNKHNVKLDEDGLKFSTIENSFAFTSAGDKTVNSKKSFSSLMRDAGYRIAANQSAKVTNSFILNMLKAKGADNETINSITSFLETEYGTAMVSFLLGSLIEQFPPVNNDSRIDRLGEELQINAMTQVGNELVGEIGKHIIPTFNSIIKEQQSTDKKPLRIISEEKSNYVTSEDLDTMANVLTKENIAYVS